MSGGPKHILRVFALLLCAWIVSSAAATPALARGGGTSARDLDVSSRIIPYAPAEAYRPPTAETPPLLSLAESPPRAMRMLIRAPAAWGVLVAGLVFSFATLLANRAGGLVNAWPESAVVEAVCAGFTACVLSVLIRASLLLELPQGSPGWPGSLLLANQDVALIAVLSLLAAGIGGTFAALPALRRAMIWCFRGVCLGLVLHAYLNLLSVEHTDAPWSAQWVRAARGLGAPSVGPTVAGLASVHSAASLAAFLSAFVLLLEGTRRLVRAFHSEGWRVWVTVSLCALVAGYLQVSGVLVEDVDVRASALENPWMHTLRASGGALAYADLLDAVPPTWASEEYESITRAHVGVDASIGNQDAGAVDHESRIRNALVVVVQGLPPAFFEVAMAATTQEQTESRLSRFRRGSVTVSDIYAPAPSADKSLYAIITGHEPPLAYASPFTSRPRDGVTSLPALLSAHGYDTWLIRGSVTGAVFASPDDVVTRFLRAHGLKNDLQARAGCAEPDSSWGGCVLSQIEAELAASRENRRPPFLGVVVFGLDADSHDHTIALGSPDARGAEAAVVKILEALERNGLAETTIVAVIGTAHVTADTGVGLQERYIRVPLALFNPVALGGSQIEGIASLSDLPPTITQLLGVPGSSLWTGRSVFERTLESFVFFFSPYPPYEFGFRDRNWKTVYSAGPGTLSIFDLQRDPGEQSDIGPLQRELTYLEHSRLTAWLRGRGFSAQR